MGRLRLPNPTEIEVIKRFLSESSHMWVEAVKFSKPAAGLQMSVTYRNFADETKVQTLTMPDAKDFEELTLCMSDTLDTISGVAVALMNRAKARRAEAHG